jgi:RND family efflux transporter MFP subunit
MIRIAGRWTGALAARLPGVPWALLLLMLLAAGGCGSEGSEGSEGSGEEDGTEVAAAPAEGGEEGEQTQGEEEAEPRAPRERTTSVEASPVFRGRLVVPVIAEGTIRARRSADLKSEIAGRLERIPVAEGQEVSAGRLLAKIDDREYRVELEEARSQYLEALSRLAVEQEALAEQSEDTALQDSLRELEQLEEQGVITREERLSRTVDLEVEAVKEGAYRRELVEARTGLLAARAAEERARLNLERTEIRAPFAGVVSGLDLAPGERVTAGESVCTLVDNVDLEAEVGVLESDLGGIAVGRPALLAVPALEETLDVRVDVIDPRVDTESRTCRVLLRFRNQEGRIRPGMFVRASIAADIYPDKLLVPREAVLTRDGRPLVFKVEEDRTKWVYVRTGLRNERLIEIERVLQGGPLDDGDLVVVSDHLTLTHDSKIRVKKVVNAADPWAEYVEGD